VAKSFTNMDDLLKYLESNIPIDLEKIGEEIKGVLRFNVQQLWYNRPFTPTHYTRTFELIDSITCSKAKKVGNGEYQVQIYFDTDKINPYPSENGEWSKHESITTGTNIAPYLPLWIEEGQNSPLFSYDGVHPVETTIDWVIEDQYLKNRMIELLEKRGFKCM
jgi:hypothetical protein